jgi:hypothetical protein
MIALLADSYSKLGPQQLPIPPPQTGSSKPDSAIAIQELRSGPGLKTLERYVGTATDAGSAQVQNHRAVQKAYER